MKVSLPLLIVFLFLPCWSTLSQTGPVRHVPLSDEQRIGAVLEELIQSIKNQDLRCKPCFHGPKGEEIIPASKG